MTRSMLPSETSLGPVPVVCLIEDLEDVDMTQSTLCTRARVQACGMACFGQLRAAISTLQAHAVAACGRALAD